MRNFVIVVLLIAFMVRPAFGPVVSMLVFGLCFFWPKLGLLLSLSGCLLTALEIVWKLWGLVKPSA